MEGQSKTDENFYLTAFKVLDLASRTLEIFESSKVTEKRVLLNFLLQNPVLSGRNLLFKLKSPFDVIAQCAKTQDWLPLLDTFRTFCWNRIRQELTNLERMNPLFAALRIDQECNSLVNVNVKEFSQYRGKDISHCPGKDISHPCGKQISHFLRS